MYYYWLVKFIKYSINLMSNTKKEENFNFDTYRNIFSNANNCKLPNGTFLSFHSPVNLHIYDEDGNHLP